MAGAHCAATSSAVIARLHRRHHVSTASGIPRKSIFIVSSLAAPFPTKPTKRRNYLRQKIHKTLKKPFNSELPSTEPVISIDFPIRQEEVKAHEETEFQELEKFENQESVGLEETEIQELDKFENQGFREAAISSSSGVIVDGSIGRFRKNSVLKYGLWLVGAFVFHTVCAVWIFRSATLDSNDRIFSENDKDVYSGSDENEKNKSKVELFLNGNGIVGSENVGVNSVVNVDEVEMERKIEEIRTMAREARAREKLESKNNGLDSEEKYDIDDGKFIKSGIEKEVDNRLIKLQKKLEKSHKKLPVQSVGILRTADERKNGLEKDKLGEKEGNGALMFKKKYKFKDLSNNLDEKPKGFINSEHEICNKFKQSGNVEKGNELLRSRNDDNYIGDIKGSDLIHLEENGEEKGTVEVTVSLNSMTKKSVKEKGTRKQGNKGVANLKVKKGIVQDQSHLSPTVESMKSRNSEEESEKLSESAPCNKLFNGNYSLNGKEVGNTQDANNVEDVKSKSETDFWWLNLPYVLGILMHSGHADEGRHGLYTLKSTANAGGDLSHTVAFEDRGDASNFCYLLHSYFNDLKDFGAEIVPLKVAELNQAVKSHTMRLVVVKKGQLRLYAGQPLDDAEMALRALVK